MINRGSLFPEAWPTSPDQEREFEQHLIEHYPADDPRLEVVFGKPEGAPSIRVRVIRDMIGWVAFQCLLGDFTASSLLLVAWGMIAAVQHRIIYALIYGFIAMQFIFGFRTYRAMKLAEASAVVLSQIQS